jgi:hypothetical protein
MFLDKCKDFKSTVVFLKTNHSKIIGLYSPDTWVRTKEGEALNISNSKTLQFYFSNGDVKIVKDNVETRNETGGVITEDFQPKMTSNDNDFLGFVSGIQINKDRKLADRLSLSV